MTSIDYEREIVSLLSIQRRALNTFRIARKVGCSWPTARKYLKLLNAEGRVRRKKKGRKTLWEI